MIASCLLSVTKSLFKLNPEIRTIPRKHLRVQASHVNFKAMRSLIPIHYWQLVHKMLLKTGVTMSPAIFECCETPRLPVVSHYHVAPATGTVGHYPVRAQPLTLAKSVCMRASLSRDASLEPLLSIFAHSSRRRPRVSRLALSPRLSILHNPTFYPAPVDQACPRSARSEKERLSSHRAYLAHRTARYPPHPQP